MTYPNTRNQQKPGHPMAPTYTKGLTIKLIKETKIAKCRSVPRGSGPLADFDLHFDYAIIPAESLVIVWDLDVPPDFRYLNRPVYGPVLLWNEDLWCNFEVMNFRKVLTG